ncbi:hypothetical protein G9A89_022431 [Geosiphon pyriformis]|nr:hypothetical protein G9A89_022431 [Geosiphon pyriformis]
MHVCHNYGKQGHIQINCHTYSNQQLGNQYRNPDRQSRPISKYLSANDAVINLLTTSILTSSLSITATGNLLTAASSNLLTTAPNNLSVSIINPNTDPKLSYDNIKKSETQNCSKLEISNGCSSTNPQLLSPKLKTLFLEFGYRRHPKPKFSKLFKSPELEQTPTNNIPSATITKDESLDTIFLFELKELSTTPLFSGAVLEEKPITIMYTDVKINGHFIKLILDSGSAGSIITRQLMDQLGHRVDQVASTRIIMADEVTKTPIGEINDLPIKINGIIVPIKVLVMKATQY